MIVEGRAASDASKLSTTLLDDLTKSKSRAKFRVSRRFGGGEGLARWDAEWDGEAVQVAGMKRVSKARGTLVEKSTKIQAEKERFHISKSSHHRGKENVFDPSLR